MEALTTFKTFTYAHEATIAKSLLTSGRHLLLS